ncbi:hypothetical protein BFO_1805 [Tannerella forsythia 92A2]|uniref:Uncharacterized protein n=1 Tax=Tannerella forsythia (strain ATCC 43037 / JCM 10827 / CCUG 21028 A / KCTC 5666 / FDC 338) TaxID=203275 RepID=G8UNN4_TANFA|nr:hypothetical protein BFO_1805 [Tannerella forsythia 92A2]BAR49156.1 hypothetical protein TF3313_1651 [Tannerella forsythia 3313]
MFSVISSMLFRKDKNRKILNERQNYTGETVRGFDGGFR